MHIRTNHQYRNTLDWCQLTTKEQREFDYLDTDDARSGAEFVRYKGWIYDAAEFMNIDKRIAPHPQRPGWEHWDGYHSDSFFSGILIKFDTDSRVRLATFTC